MWQDKPDSQGLWWTVVRDDTNHNCVVVAEIRSPLDSYHPVEIIGSDEIYAINDEYFVGKWMKAEVPALPQGV